jgi:hypothetical protein
MAYLILDEIRSKDGGYIPYLAWEGEKGYYLTNGNYGLDQERGQGNPRCICSPPPLVQSRTGLRS